MNKLIYSLAGIIILGVIFYFGYTSHHSMIAGNVGPGVSNLTGRSAQISGNGTATSTWFSLLNSDANDRIIELQNLVVSGTSGVGSTSAEVINCATSTNAYDLNSNTNYTLTITLQPVSTNILNAIVASATAGTITASSSISRDWAAGAYLNCIAGASGVANSGLTTSTTTEYYKVSYIPL